jgi:hypothetical protein
MTELKRNTIWLTLLAIAMAYVEATLVVYLRSIYHPDNPLVVFPLVIMSQRDFAIELARELATMVMILSVALLAARGFTRTFAACVYVFGLWDIFYYLWLKLMIGWPVTWLEWDVLFLMPWPWFGPWITPALIALQFVLWGGWILLVASDSRFTLATAVLFVLGVFLTLASFLLPAVPLLPDGKEAFNNFQPDTFLWHLYMMGYLLMGVSLWRVARSDAGKSWRPGSNVRIF